VSRAQYDTRIQSVADRLSQDLVDESGHPADAAHVADVVMAKAEPLEDAPLQEFVPLLVEHEAAQELRAEGLRRVLPEA
jgi:hypothetical protein